VMHRQAASTLEVTIKFFFMFQYWYRDYAFKNECFLIKTAR